MEEAGWIIKGLRIDKEETEEEVVIGQFWEVPFEDGPPPYSPDGIGTMTLLSVWGINWLPLVLGVFTRSWGVWYVGCL